MIVYRQVVELKVSRRVKTYVSAAAVSRQPQDQFSIHLTSLDHLAAQAAAVPYWSDTLPTLEQFIEPTPNCIVTLTENRGVRGGNDSRCVIDILGGVKNPLKFGRM